MPLLFECLGCGSISLIEATAPRCPQCGHGNGLIQNPPEDKSKQQDASKSKKDS